MKKHIFEALNTDIRARNFSFLSLRLKTFLIILLVALGLRACMYWHYKSFYENPKNIAAIKAAKQKTREKAGENAAQNPPHAQDAAEEQGEKILTNSPLSDTDPAHAPADEVLSPPSPSETALAEAGFVNLSNPEYPKFYFDMRYAAENNFTGQKIYDFNSCWLRKEAADALVKARAAAQKLPKPLTFILYDCYRPAGAHKKLWGAYPDADYVAPPEKGSRHSRGMAVDLTLSDDNGNPLEMPTEFDSFSRKAHMNYNGKGISDEAKANRELLKKLMTDAGFDYTRTEWWHFDKTGWRQKPLEDITP